MRHFILLVVSVLPFLAGCGPTKATLFVDNDSKTSYRVEIEGHKSLYVGPNRSAKRHLPYGEHNITVKQKGRIVYQGKKNFEPHPNGPSWRHYLLDPEADTTYAVREYFYYENQKEAKTKPQSRYVQQLYRNNWIDVPKGAMAMSPSSVVFTSEDCDRSGRLCVVRDR